MNRRKKIITKFNNKDKRANAKLHKSNKPAYVSKAERAKLAEQDAEQAIEQAANEVVQTSV
ncbi:DUF2986 domain-containing protein [Pseudoalteromonas sp. S1608]|uniref:DUF2986 domain-containing protein n=1 Tax=Pseudoalteromonas sp. S1608 TaxID=579504 RepID=UPI00110BF453|nr:DUF2986 domain-containing protein [Pseudoalteromonas sp. S1608]TMP74667.1 DUF2986 domain-containing protein [Pseudoalteromonas sp. S1608]